VDKVILEQRADGVRLLTLNDPDRRNAIDRTMRQELADAVADVARDRDARALVVTGAGVAFCAGGNLPDLVGPPGRRTDEMRDDLSVVYDSFLGIRRLAIPTLAAVQGAAVGAGVNLALSCDLRLMGPDGYLDVRFARMGIHPGGGCTAFLVDVLGRQQALHLLLQGARLDAAESVDRGLALSVAEDPAAAALELAADIATLDPILVRDIKATVGVAATGDFEASLTAEAWAQAASLGRSPAVLQPRPKRA
jgi:enoyl-CoA hydratase